MAGLLLRQLSWLVRRVRFACSGLSRWITVATPFIVRRRRILLFTRLGLAAKALYLTFFSFAVFLTVLIALQAPDLAGGTEQSLLYEVVKLLLIAFSPLIAVHAILLLLDLRRTRWYATTDSRMTLLADRWLSLRHPADEAIGGLRAVSQFEFPIVGKRFIVEPLTTASALVSPIICIGLVWIFLLPEYAFSRQGYPLYVFVTNMIGMFGGLVRLTLGLENIFSYVVVFLIAFPAILFLFSSVLIVAIRYMALGASGFVSSRLNRLVWREIRRSSYGDDTADAMSYGAADRPVWAQTAQPELPRELALELESYAARASAASVLKLRVAVQELVFRGDDPKSQVIAEYLSWNELIHTSYFKAASFRKLMAFVVSQSSGFRASEKFKSDPEYAVIAQWYEQTVRPSSS